MWPSNGLHMSMYMCEVRYMHGYKVNGLHMYVREVRYMYMYGYKVKKLEVKQSKFFCSTFKWTRTAS